MADAGEIVVEAGDMAGSQSDVEAAALARIANRTSPAGTSITLARVRPSSSATIGAAMKFATTSSTRETSPPVLAGMAGHLFCMLVLWSFPLCRTAPCQSRSCMLQANAHTSTSVSYKGTSSNLEEYLSERISGGARHSFGKLLVSVLSTVCAPLPLSCQARYLAVWTTLGSTGVNYNPDHA